MSAGDPLDDGNLLLHWYYRPHPTPGFVVENAAPETRVSAEFLLQAAMGVHRGVTMKRDTTSAAPHLTPCGDPCWQGWLLDIDADNQHVIYRICRYLPDVNGWEARWPD